MKSTYRSPHWAVFSKISHAPSGPVGYIPSEWAESHGLSGFPFDLKELPRHKLTRADVRAICMDHSNSVLFCYVCVMAWGLQGAVPGTRRHVKAALQEWKRLEIRLQTLRERKLTRAEAYDLFAGSNSISGLGPAYFTKLLFFLQQEDKCYIMDQHTGKSINLLTGFRVVRMVGNAVSSLNKSGNYQAYCEEVDNIAGLLGKQGSQIEEQLMSKGGKKPWPWRAHVREAWKEESSEGRYDRKIMASRYTHIDEHSF